MALNVVVKYNMKLVAEEAKERGRLRKSATVQEDFGFDNRRFVAVPLDTYVKNFQYIKSLVAQSSGIVGIRSEEKRLAAFNQLFTTFVDKNIFTGALIYWKSLHEIKT